MTVAARIEEKLAALDPESIEIVDRSAEHAGHEGARGGGGHFQLIIVSKAFTGKPVQLRHRMVYEALASMMHKDIHALAIKAYAPGEI